MHSMNDTLRNHLQVAVSLLKTLRGKAVSKAFPLYGISQTRLFEFYFHITLRQHHL